MSDKIAIVATLRAVEGQGDAVVEAFRAAGPDVQAETGTELYIAHRSPDDPDVVIVYELYTDQAAREAHSAGEPIRKIGRSLKGLLAAPPELKVMSAVTGKGL
jgi:quinol monooxygenase YgiN